MIGIYFEQREVLRARIDARVEHMLSLGLEEEVRSLWRSGVLNGESGGAQAIGYKEWIPYFEGKQTREETIQQIKTATAQYAKRQMTFFDICGMYIGLQQTKKMWKKRHFVLQNLRVAVK